METLIDYSLVIIFFVLLGGFVVVVLSQHPYTDSESTDEVVKSIRTERTKKIRARIGDMLGYGLVAVVLGSLFVMTFLSERKHA